MEEEARNLGGDAITDLRFSTAYMMGGAAEILVFGNAVKLGREG